MTLVPLLRLYPRRWRRRYGDEMAFVVSSAPPTFRLAVDLIAGAVDARLNPQLTPRMSADTEGGGLTMGSFLAHCQPAGATREDHVRSAAWMVGGTLALAIVYYALRSIFGPVAIIEAFGFALFPIVLVLSSRPTYLKRYSRGAASVMMAGTILIVLGITLLATLIAERL